MAQLARDGPFSPESNVPVKTVRALSVVLLPLLATLAFSCGTSAGGTGGADGGTGGGAAGGTGGGAAGGTGGGTAGGTGGGSTSDAGEFARWTFAGTPYEIIEAGFNTVTPQVSGIAPEVVGFIGQHINPAPAVSVIVTPQYFDAGTPGSNVRCGLTLGIPNDAGTTVTYVGKSLSDGGSDCALSFSQFAASTGQFYEGTFMGNVTPQMGDGGATFAVTNGTFRVKR